MTKSFAWPLSLANNDQKLAHHFSLDCICLSLQCVMTAFCSQRLMCPVAPEYGSWFSFQRKYKLFAALWKYPFSPPIINTQAQRKSARDRQMTNWNNWRYWNQEKKSAIKKRPGEGAATAATTRSTAWNRSIFNSPIIESHFIGEIRTISPERTERLCGSFSGVVLLV